MIRPKSPCCRAWASQCCVITLGHNRERNNSNYPKDCMSNFSLKLILLLFTGSLQDHRKKLAHEACPHSISNGHTLFPALYFASCQA